MSKVTDYPDGTGFADDDLIGFVDITNTTDSPDGTNTKDTLISFKTWATNLALKAANNLSDLANAATARTNLGVEIGSDVQAHSAVLDATTASFTTADETKLDGIEASADVTDAANVAAAGGYVAGGTDVAVADGGTGASTAAGALANLGAVGSSDGTITDIIALTQAEYDALTPDPTTFYVVTA